MAPIEDEAIAETKLEERLIVEQRVSVSAERHNSEWAGDHTQAWVPTDHIATYAGWMAAVFVERDVRYHKDDYCNKHCTKPRHRTRHRCNWLLMYYILEEVQV
eukprot:CAMPEP_0180579492 /NCGR_PEP_ID=MMETSP1037_2-20121125/13020_1 /TAXON_ID=632150 /ORGANISM="Azadinium spinosum, Strain 3D9" /LENGTH=102 /DNA_ID=CAMNT_0022597357 /DNA_START=846 /DNA_END=1154 /DNA_ORIENTATION=-